MLLFATGFESESSISNSTFPGFYFDNNGSDRGVTLDSGVKRSGSNSLKVQYGSDINGGFSSGYYQRFHIWTGNRTNILHYGFGLRFTTRPGLGPRDWYQYHPAGMGFLQIGRYPGSGTDGRIIISFDSTGRLWAYNAKTSSYIGTGINALGASTQYYFQIKMINDSTNGQLKIYIGNQLEMDITGLNTATVNIDYIDQIMFYAGGSSGSGFPACQLYVDDIVVMNSDGSANNTFPMGIMRVTGTRPNADGDMTEQTASTGDRWNCVDELAAAGADYVQTDTTNKKILFNFTDVTPTGRIRGMFVYNVMGRSDAGSGISKYKFVYRDISDNEADSTYLNTTMVGEYVINTSITVGWVQHQYIYDVNPITGVDQTNQDIYEMQLGFKTTQIE